MKIINIKKEPENSIIAKTVSVLKNGGLIVYPTETCYGIGADATNPVAVKKILQFKGGREGKPISIAVADKKMAGEYVEINKMGENLYANFLPGPLTIVSKSRKRVVRSLESISETLGIRIPDYSLILKIIRNFGKPITSTSANSSGKKSPYSIEEIIKYTSKKRVGLVDLFLDAGRLANRPPSTVVDTTLNEPEIVRQGEIFIPKVAGQIFISNSEEETKKIAQKILKKYKKLLSFCPLVFALQGDLGSGKTQFVKGLALELGIKDNVPSPTFIFLREYPFVSEGHKGKLYHIDTWRMQTGEELLDLEFEKMLKPGNVIAIEWLQKVRPILEKIAKTHKVCLIWVTIEIISEAKRKIKYQHD